MKPEDISARMKLIMETKELSVKKLARRSGVRPPTIYQWKRGESIPRGDGLVKLANGLAVTTDFLTGRLSYDGASPRETAVKESLAVYFQQEGIQPGHPDYDLYINLLSDPDSAPMEVEEWRKLREKIIPTVQEFFEQQKKLKRRKVPVQKPSKKTKGIIVPIQTLSHRSKRKP